MVADHCLGNPWRLGRPAVFLSNSLCTEGFVDLWVKLVTRIWSPGA